MNSDTCRQWTRAIAQLHSRAAKTKRGALPPDTVDLLDRCLEACDSLLQELAAAEVQSETLAATATSQSALWNTLFELMPVACVETDAAGAILTANRSAAQVLNISPKYLANRLLLHFARDRQAFADLLLRLPIEEGPVRTSLHLHPRERAPFDVEATIVPRGSNGSSTWLWFLVASSNGHGVPRNGGRPLSSPPPAAP